jgi:hypothetical protein
MTNELNLININDHQMIAIFMKHDFYQINKIS